MTTEQRKTFYLLVGKALTSARQQRNMTIADVSRLVDEQYITIKSIEQGKVCSLHHFVWMVEHFGLNFENIVEEMREQHDKRIEKVDDLI